MSQLDLMSHGSGILLPFFVKSAQNSIQNPFHRDFKIANICDGTKPKSNHKKNRPAAEECASRTQINESR